MNLLEPCYYTPKYCTSNSLRNQHWGYLNLATKHHTIKLFEPCYYTQMKLLVRVLRYETAITLLLSRYKTSELQQWLAMYVERVADDEMCIYCLGVNNDFSFLFFFYIFLSMNLQMLYCLELFLHDKIWKAWKFPFVSEI